MCRVLIVCYWVAAVIFASTANAAQRPVVVIPGVMGSKLCDGAGNTIWGDRASYTAKRMHALRLPFDTDKHDKTIDSCGLIESISVIPLLWESNVYSALLKVLRDDLKYANNNIIIFHYDWRLSNFENASRLRDEINRRFPGDA